jgi:DNA-binding XRE family transcriptional regulator
LGENIEKIYLGHKTPKYFFDYLTFALVKKTPNKKFLKALGKRIKGLREKHDISQDQLAFECDTTQKQISKVELGQINTSAERLRAIADAFDMKLKELFDFEY